MDLTTLASLRACWALKAVREHANSWPARATFSSLRAWLDAQNCGKMQISELSERPFRHFRVCRALKTVVKCKFVTSRGDPFVTSCVSDASKLWQNAIFSSATWKICVLPQFWTSDTSEVTKGSIGDVKNLRFTTVLSVRHVRSDERVDRRREKFAFYHSFERPTRPKWRRGRSATWKICVLPQFWASDTREVTRGVSNPQVRPLRPDRKRIYFKTFSEDFD